MGSRPEHDGLDLPGCTHRIVDVGEVSLHVVLAGEEDGPLVVLLHGFPEFWWSWRYQIPALVHAGFRVAAPDLRGYNLSDQPRDVSAYTLPHLRGDVEGLIRALGRQHAHIVGHDWGAMLAWDFAMRLPRRVDRLAILNVPHPRVMARALLRSPKQMKKSWYVLMFQIPGLAEALIRRDDDYESIRRSLRAGRLVQPPPEEIEPYVDAAKRANALRGGIAYYRASFRGAFAGMLGNVPRIEAPVLVVWGERDLFLGKELAVPPSELVPNARVEFLKEASHWVQVDAPQRVNQLLVGALRS